MEDKKSLISESGISRKFSQETERNARTNKTLVLISSFIEGILGIMLVLQCIFLSKGNNTFIVTVAVLVLAVLIINVIVYLKNPGGKNFKYVSSFGFMIPYTVLLLTGENNIVFIYIIPWMIISVLYMDKILTYGLCGIMGTFNLIRFIMDIKKDGIVVPALSMVMTALIIISIIEFYRLHKKYNADIQGVILDEHEKQERMLEEILKIGSAVKVEMNEAWEKVETLQQISSVVASAVDEISSTSMLTAENIQEQTVMTQDIQEDLNGVAELSEGIVRAAESSKKIVDESIVVVSNMKNQSVHITESNKEVMQSMNQLEGKTVEVKEIANIIFDISSQTNLLALNASIESARAGEAGRGFAVVAEQIRQLSEQTRKSTESIAMLIEDLNKNAKEATKTVETSIDSMMKQNELIAKASDSFNLIKENVGDLSDSIHFVDQKIVKLEKANNTIVDSISQLSSTSEEVTATCQEAREMGKDNHNKAEEVKENLTKVKRTVDELDKYLN